MGNDDRSADKVALAQSIADIFGRFPEVQAIALGGSIASGNADQGSDIDLYVYATQELPAASRARLIGERATHAEINNRIWEPGDEWNEAASGTAVDLMYRHPAWIEEQLDRVLNRQEASVGYSTCFWHNVRHSVPLIDRNGWFRRLQEQASRPYPEELVGAIVAKNHPILRNTISSYLHQLKKAVQRDDLVSVNHRAGALLASYFDIVFAVNRTTNPGEKRVLDLATRCKKTPAQMAEQVYALLGAACFTDRSILLRANELLDRLDELLITEGLIDS